jgi:1-deoxy-D-xylulose-5-phosphate synthase
VYDFATGGHASSSISTALGIAEAEKHIGQKNNIITVIGDGALTGGLAFEGLNNISAVNDKLIIVINDNEMSISENVGAFSRHLSDLRASSEYQKTKKGVKIALDNIPLLGKGIKTVLASSKNAVKKAIYKNSYFTDMGIDYYGPIDGHDLDRLISAFMLAKNENAPSVIHIVTKKGKGYLHSENNPKKFHGVGPFDKKTGKTEKTEGKTFSSEFGAYLLGKSADNEKVCAITAAMADGTGLFSYSEAFPERFYDVGIAEEHAAVFASGLATGGMIPVVAIYSAFLLRATDEIINDCAIEKRHVVFAVDRAGFVGADGETHNGLFDVSVFSSVPGAEIYCPSNYNELRGMLDEAIDENDGVAFVRYPKGREDEIISSFEYSKNAVDKVIDNKSHSVIITYGATFPDALKAAKKTGADLIKINKISGYKLIPDMLKNYKKALFFEEGIKSGSIAEKLGSLLLEKGVLVNYKVIAVDDEFVPHMTINEAREKYSLSEEGIIKTIEEM